MGCVLTRIWKHFDVFRITIMFVKLHVVASPLTSMSGAWDIAGIMCANQLLFVPIRHLLSFTTRDHHRNWANSSGPIPLSSCEPSGRLSNSKRTHDAGKVGDAEAHQRQESGTDEGRGGNTTPRPKGTNSPFMRSLWEALVTRMMHAMSTTS